MYVRASVRPCVRTSVRPCVRVRVCVCVCVCVCEGWGDSVVVFKGWGMDVVCLCEIGRLEYSWVCILYAYVCKSHMGGDGQRQRGGGGDSDRVLAEALF